MARVMSYFNRNENDNLHILVATSGDTGSAVGSAFHNVVGGGSLCCFDQMK